MASAYKKPKSSDTGIYTKHRGRKNIAYGIEIPSASPEREYRMFSVPEKWTPDEIMEYMRTHLTKVG
jgi:hypothetical protein